MTDQTPLVYTIGHSTRSIDELVDLLSEYGIEAVADVRTSPYSARLPWFNRETLTTSLERANIRYVFLGRELGGRGNGPGVMGPDGRVQYTKIAATELFQDGIARVIDGSATLRIALLCSEKDPLNCHRALLVARQLDLRGVPIEHILGTGSTETHQQFEERLLNTVNMPPELTRTEEEILADAYDKQASRVAYKQEPRDDGEVDA